MSDSVFRCFACMQPIASAQAVCPHCGHDNHVRDNGPGYLPQLVLQNQYLVGKMLGHGGFGVTYLGYDLILDRVVAIKEYFPRDFAMRDSQSVSLSAYSDHAADFKSGCQRALRESQMAAGLGQIPNVVSVHNAVIANNTVYIIMEYIDGETLSSYVKRNGGKLPLAQALRLLMPIASALEALHERGVIHRDVKPDNIMVRRGTDSTVLLDFGAARVLDSKTMSLSSVIYSPGYAPPEQCSSVAVMDARVDQYAFCATLYFALTGQTPTDCQLRLYNSMELPSICTLNDSVSPAAEAVILRGMAVKAENRYPGMGELMEALRNPEPEFRPKPEPKPEPEPKPKTETETKTDSVEQSPPARGAESEYVMEPIPDSEPNSAKKTNTRTKSKSILAKVLLSIATLTETLDDGTLAITSCFGKKTIITIPSTIFGKTVTKIGDGAFYECSSLAQVSIPDSVTEIGCSAFEGCTSLTQISIPDSVTKIGERAFYNCTSLAQVNIPDSVTKIGEYAFAYCESLTQLSIPDSVTKIGEYAFSSCKSLTQISIPNSVTVISFNAFIDCSSLTQVTIPDSVTVIGGYAFMGCTSLAQISIPNSVTVIGGCAFYHCTSLTQVSIPDSVTEIQGSAFERCSSLTQVSIPDSVIEIGDGAFDNCSPDLTLLVSPGSYAERWAKNNGIAYRNN